MLKKIFTVFLLFLIIGAPAFAEENKRIVSQITNEFSVADMPEYVVLKATSTINIKDTISIPENSFVTVYVLEAQPERRWHKSGYILGKLISYTQDSEDDTVDISAKNIYVAIRKHEVLNKKDAAILTTELVITQAASIVGSVFIVFAPVDIAYFFAKGAIQRKKHPHWFKAGFYNAYDNSIFWFWFKGKPIELAVNETVKLQSVREKKAFKLQSQIMKRKVRQFAKKEMKQLNKEIKQGRKIAKETENKENSEKLPQKTGIN